VNEIPNISCDPIKKKKKEIGNEFKNEQWRGDQENKIRN
jgi:hypothetical protein